jgi:hypothetical protein
VDDMKLTSDALCAVAVTSTKPHARLKHIDPSKALEVGAAEESVSLDFNVLLGWNLFPWNVTCFSGLAPVPLVAELPPGSECVSLDCNLSSWVRTCSTRFQKAPVGVLVVLSELQTTGSVSMRRVQVQ